MASQGISGAGIAVVTAGALAVYAGLHGVSIVEALRNVASGHPTGLPASTSGDSSSTITSGTAGNLGQSSSALVQAAFNRRGEKYSQAKRWQDGYSDCSSFVGKCLNDIGQTFPGASTTGNYLGWSQLRGINRSDVAAGDLIINSAHMIIAIDGTNGIGQQNSKRNVVIGTIKDLMTYTGSYGCYRFKSAVANTSQHYNSQVGH